MNRKSVLKIVNSSGLDFPYRLASKWDKEVEKTIKLIKRRLKKELLPKIKMFKDFKIVFGKGYSNLGIYIGGSYHIPIIILNLIAIKQACKEYDNIPLNCAIETTILHELGHAIQDYKQIIPNEEEAEEFAIDYYDFGIIRKVGQNEK